MKPKLEEIVYGEMNERKIKSIEVDKGGFGRFSLFVEGSTKDELVQDNSLSGKFLEELGITYEVGDIIKVKMPSKNIAGCYSISDIKIYEVTEDLYKGEFL